MMAQVDDMHRRAGGPRPIDALDHHVRMIQILKSANHRQILAGPMTRSMWADGQIASADDEVARIAATNLDRAATIVVTPRMLDVILERMPSVEFGQPLDFQDLLFTHGYVELPRAIEVPLGEDDDPTEIANARPKTSVLMNGGAWFIEPKLTITSGIYPNMDEAERKLRAEFGEMGTGVVYGQFAPMESVIELTLHDIDQESDEDKRRTLEGLEVVKATRLPLFPVYWSAWQFGRSWDPELRDPDFVLTIAGEWERRFWYSLWKTLREEVIAPVRLPRAVGRRAARLRADIPEVVVADLRRIKKRWKEEETSDGGTILWSHRWRVREHERTLHRGTPDERVIVVREHIKGPEHLPLLEKDRVYRLRR